MHMNRERVREVRAGGKRTKIERTNVRKDAAFKDYVAMLVHNVRYSQGIPASRE